MSKMAIDNLDDLFEIKIVNAKEQVFISLFEEIEAELCDAILHSNSPEDDETDGAIEFIKNIVNTIKSKFKDIVIEEKRQKFLNILTKIFPILLSVKADSAEKVIKIVKLAVSTVLKIWSEQN